jgi:hypothetical protein
MARFVLLIALSSSLAAAQSPSNSWELSANVGAGFRSERGHLLGGARLGAALSKPIGASERRFELGLGYAQITAHEGPTGDGANIKENSFELGAMGEWPLLTAGKARIAGAIGPVMAYSMGCTAGGSYAGDQAGYGDAPCTNDFAEKGNVRFGGTARATVEFRGDRASFVIGALTSAGTVAAGDAFAWGSFIGFRAPLK